MTTMRVFLAVAVLAICTSFTIGQEPGKEPTKPPPTEPPTQPPPTEPPNEEARANLENALQTQYQYSDDAEKEAHEKIMQEYEEEGEKLEVEEGATGKAFSFGVRRYYFSVWTSTSASRSCCCPTVNTYYRLHSMYWNGHTWYPFGHGYHLWFSGGRCLDNRVCYTNKLPCPWQEKRCMQQYKYIGFLVYNWTWHWPYFQVSYHNFRIPSFCDCPHCCPR